jgi:hypothetical protein
VFKKYKASIKHKFHPNTVSQSDITQTLYNLYSEDLSSLLFFYYQDENDSPIDKISTKIVGTSFYCTVSDSNRLCAKDWVDVPRPVGWKGKLWLSRILTHRTLRGCAKCSNRSRLGKHCKCSNDMKYDWRDFWILNILLRNVGTRGIVRLRERLLAKMYLWVSLQVRFNHAIPTSLIPTPHTTPLS